MSSAYSNVVGGKLKLKKPIPGVSSSKAPSRVPASSAQAAVQPPASRKRPAEDDAERDESGAAKSARSALDDRGAGASSSSSSSSARSSGAAAPALPDNRTAAQRAFEEAQAARLSEQARKIASKSHAQRVSEFNTLLEKLPEHNDLFKIQYAGTG